MNDRRGPVHIERKQAQAQSKMDTGQYRRYMLLINPKKASGVSPPIQKIFIRIYCPERGETPESFFVFWLRGGDFFVYDLRFYLFS